MTATDTPNLLIARLLDYFGRRTDWQRRLWNPGTITVLAETVEALEFLESGHLREASVKEVLATARKRAGPDLGIGPNGLRNAIQESLAAGPKDALLGYKLEHLLDGVESGYLARWAKALAEDPEQLGTEAASRYLAGHLLGLGFSPEALHRWATWLSHQNPQTLSEVFVAAEEKAQQEPREWDVLIPITSIDHSGQQMPPEWIEQQEVRSWLDALGSSPRPVRHAGGFLLKQTALDPWTAVEIASDVVESLAARVAVGMPGHSRFSTAQHAYVAGTSDPYSLARPRRQVDIHCLKRQNALYSISEPALEGRLRSAIDLLTPLETGAPGAAIAGGWAAIEAILARPDTPNVQAASDMATLVACSFPRAELTPLTYSYENEHNDSVAHQISAAASNKERCAVLGAAIAQGNSQEFVQPSDSAAVDRIRAILTEPKQALLRVTDYVSEAIRRLYRQRNLVLHAGITNSVAMNSTLSTAPPLVGAGFDRLVHDALVAGNSEPLRLVARAQVELSLCDTDRSRHVWDLLGQ